jgi:DNA-cytosine methyltransferase
VRTHLDLFSGIGGFALAAGWAGFTTVGFVEYEDFPKRLLSRRFPCIPIHSDIHDFDATPFRGVDLITGGFPCQPFSAAGKQRGKEDDRWLWKEMLRVVVEAQPTWMLAENVAGIINMALDEVLADLEAEDYATGTVILPACAKNALHRRDRVWIIARNARDTTSDRGSQIRQVSGRSDSNPRGICADVAHSEGNGLQGGRAKDKRSEYSEEVGQRNQESLRNSAGSTEGDVAHSKCQSVRDKGSGQDASETSSSKGELRERQRIWTDPSECSTDVAHSNSKRRCSRDTQRQDAEEAWESSRSTQHGTGKFVGRLGGSLDGIPEGLDFPRRWGDGSWEDGIPRVTTQKKGRTQRLKGLGNAIVPQVAYEIIRHFD